MELEDFCWVGSHDDGSTHIWGPVEDSLVLGSTGLEIFQPASVLVSSEDLAQGDSTFYSQTPSVEHLTDAFQSAFSDWITGADNHHNDAEADILTSQWLLKYILFSVPYLHAKHKSLRGKATLQHYEASGSHVLAERRRREKLNERFIILRSLVPFVTKTDKASILGDTIEYVKQLSDTVQSLEARKRQMEADQRRRINKKRRVKEVEVEVSIIGNDALLEVECMHREGLLVDVMKVLRELGVDVMLVQSSVNDDGVFVAELRAKVKENAKGKKVSIVEVKKALYQVIPYHH
ncbi:Myc-type, basic helix-loop-helix [Sesbania bispinosa]|nr:Myc-type, basic helix-loop-helix [Sesbania bispinosa]